MKFKANIIGLTSAVVLGMSMLSPLAVFAAEPDTVAAMVAEAEKATSDTKVTINVDGTPYTIASFGRFEYNADGVGDPEIILDSKDIYKLAIMTNQIQGAITRTKTIADDCQAKADSINALLSQMNTGTVQTGTTVNN